MKTFVPFFSLFALVLAGCPGTDDGGPVSISSFVASPTTVDPGGDVHLSWTTSGARTIEVYAYPTLADGTEGGATQLVGETTRVDGNTTDIIFRNTRYVLIAHGSTDETEEVTVAVSPGGFEDVAISNFFVEPTEVGPGEPATLFWVTAQADSVQIESRPRRVPAVEWDNDPGEVESSGQMEVAALETTEYRLRASNGDVSIYKETLLEVFGPRPQRPEITSFTATPNEIDQGDTSLLEWTTENAATVSGIPGVTATVVNGSHEVAPSRTQRFTLTAARDGFLDIAELTIVVHEIAGAPAVESFEATPALIGAGATSTLSWNTTNVDSVTIEPSVIAGGPADGSIGVTPGTTTDYFLTASGPLGEAEASLTVTVVPVGGILVSEIMDDPFTDDAHGEWIEIYNGTAESFFLTGLEILDGAGSHVVFGDLAVAAGGYAVVGADADDLVNGGVTLDYEWAGILLDPADTVTLRGGSVVLDTVVYDAGWPSVTGSSMEVNALDAATNDAAGGWCVASTGYGTDGNSGTPGSANDCP